MKLRIQFIDQDYDGYYLYKVESDDFIYYVSRSEEELKDQEQLEMDTKDYSNKYTMYDRQDFTDREWEIAKYLFNFLWESDNGTNTCADKDIYEDDGFTQNEIEKFIFKFQFDEAGVLDMYSDGGVEIYWDYFSCFNLKTCNFFEDM